MIPLDGSRCNDKVGQEYALWIKVRSTIIECKVVERMFLSSMKEHGPKFSNTIRPNFTDLWYLCTSGKSKEKKRKRTSILRQNDGKNWKTHDVLRKKLNRNLFHPINVIISIRFYIHVHIQARAFTLSFKFSNRYINIYDCYKKKEEKKKLYQIAINYTRLITIIGKLVISTLGGFRICFISFIVSIKT